MRLPESEENEALAHQNERRNLKNGAHLYLLLCRSALVPKDAAPARIRLDLSPPLVLSLSRSIFIALARGDSEETNEIELRAHAHCRGRSAVPLSLSLFVIRRVIPARYRCPYDAKLLDVIRLASPGNLGVALMAAGSLTQ